MKSKFYLRRVVLLIVLIIASIEVIAQETEDLFFGLNGPVNDMVLEGNDLYLGGNFTEIGTKTGNLALFEPNSNIPDKHFPFFGEPHFQLAQHNYVNDMVSDNNGGWYVCGSFTKAGDERIKYLAHVNRDHSIDKNFSFNVFIREGYGSLDKLLVYQDFLYVAGRFSTSGGHLRLCRINLTTGELDENWKPQVSFVDNNTIKDLVAYNNQLFLSNVVYINGVASPLVGAVSLETGEIIEGNWAASSTKQGTACIQVIDDHLYIGSNQLLSYEQGFGKYFGHGAVLEINSNLPVAKGLGFFRQAIPDGKGGWFVASEFSQIQGHNTIGLANINANLQVNTDFTQSISNGYNSVGSLEAADESYIYVKGFLHGPTQKTYNLSRFNKNTGEWDSDWIYEINSNISQVMVNDTAVFISGHFNEINGESARYFAALSTREVKVLPMGFTLNNAVLNMGLNKSHLYLEIQNENRIFRFNNKGEKDKEFVLIRSNLSNASFMMVNDSMMVLFSQYSAYSLNGSASSSICFFDLDSKTLHPLHQKFHAIKRKHRGYGSDTFGSPKIGFEGKNMIYTNHTLDSINGHYQPYIFAMDTETGKVLDFNPKPNSYFLDFVVSDKRFITIGHATAYNCTKGNFIGIDLTNNSFINELPSISGNIYSMEKNNDDLIICGNFNRINNVETNNMAIYNTLTKTIRPFPLSLTGAFGDVSIHQALPVDQYLFINGRFQKVDGQAREGLASVNMDDFTLTDWQPTFNNVNLNFKIAGNPQKIIVNGYFTLSNARKVSRMAKVNLLTEEIYNWGPEQLNDGGYCYINELRLDRDILYVGGYFNKFNETPVSNFMALDKENGGLITDFKPEFNDIIYDIFVENDHLIVSGGFTQVNNMDFFRVAKINKATGTPESYKFELKENSGSMVYEVCKINNDYLLAGKYLQKPGSPDNENYQLVKADGTSGEILSQYHFQNKYHAHGLKKLDSLVFFFTSGYYHNYPHQSVVSYSLQNDTIRNWYPSFEGNALTMHMSQSRLFISGSSIREQIPNSSGGFFNDPKDFTSLLITDANDDTTFVEFPILLGDQNKSVRKIVEWNNHIIACGDFSRVGKNLKVGGVTMISVPDNLFQPEITNFSPKVIGNEGSTTYIVYGKGFKKNAKITLTNGSTTVPVDGIYFEGDTKISGDLHLDNIPAGKYQLKVEIPGDTTMILENAMTVELAEAPDIWLNLSGPNQVTRNKPTSFYLNIGNSGNVDAYMVPVMIASEEMPIDVDTGWEDFIGSESDVDIPSTIVAGTEYGEATTKYISMLLIPVVPAKSSGVIKFKLINGNPTTKSIEVYSYPPMYNDLPAAEKSAYEVEGLGWDFFKCAWNFIPSPPGYDCIKSANDNLLLGAVDHRMKNGRKPISGWNFAKSVFTVGLDCISDLNPAAKGAKWVHNMYKITKNATSAEGKFNDCVGFGQNLVKWAQGEVEPLWSQDPNEKYGPMGIAGSHYTRSDRPWSFTIMYENVDSALVAAQKVTITDTIDVNKFDISTFTLVSAGFGDTSITYEGNLKTSVNDVDMRPDKNVIVRIENTLDEETGIAEWTFLALDPKTMELTEDVNGGFLPPNKNAPEGEGFVLFNIWPKENIKTSDTLTNRATIVFDWNEPIYTPEYYTFIDNILPESEVLPLPPEVSQASFLVEWDGLDEGSGVAWYDIFVSEDEGPYQLWLGSTCNKDGLFTGASGHTYAFYSVATDSARNVEIAPDIYDTKTTVSGSIVTPEPVVVLEQDFNKEEWPPAGWSVYQKNSIYTWMQGNVEGEDFSVIDPANVYSAICPYHETEEQDEVLVSPPFTLTGNKSVLEFYAGYSTDWLDNATLGLSASDDGEYFTHLWLSENDGEPWKFRKIQIDMHQFKNVENLQLYWTYLGVNGDIVAIDNIKLTDNLALDKDVAGLLKNELFKCYPNPFTENVLITYTLEHESKVELTITDITGKRIETLVNDYQKEGEYILNYAPKHYLPTGIYVCELKTEKRNYTIYLVKK